MKKYLEKCEICPHKCKVNRIKGDIGRCKSKDTVKVALASIHNFEEPCISGKNGSGTVFFSKCNLSCVFCQNYEISNLGKGRKISVEELSDIFIVQQENGAENINLVSPTIYVDKIIEAIKLAKNKGLKLPIIYNSNGYEKIETLNSLEGLIDVYLPDFKYGRNDIGFKYSGIKNYFEIASKAIKEMENQVGYPKFDENGMIKSGLIVRHLIMPNNIENSKIVLKWLKENLNEKTYISVMTQYFPAYKAKEFDEINRKITKEEYEEVEEYISNLGIENGYMQDFSEEDETQYVPKWNY